MSLEQDETNAARVAFATKPARDNTSSRKAVRAPSTPTRWTVPSLKSDAKRSVVLSVLRHDWASFVWTLGVPA